MRLALCLVSASILAQQQQDADFAASVKQWTTKAEFLSPLVDHLPRINGVPAPKDVLGHHIGAPKKLTYYSDIVKYFRALEKASPRVKIITTGKTDEGRECITVAIAAEDTIRNLETYKGYLARLADPRKTNEAEARQIVAQAKPIYHLTGGLHSSETGPPEMLMELAYRLIGEEGPLYDQIRKNLIVFITPTLEPDGQERYTDWYYRYKINEETEDDRIVGPPYWGKYIFHDNNRDLNYSQVTMRNWLKAYLEWHPPIVHDLHESVPFLYTFSGQAPQNPNLDPILYAELPWFANFELTKMIGYGMPGVWTHAFVDMWSVGYLGFMASNHNGMLRMYETYGNGGANTMKRKVVPPGMTGPGQTSREWYRPLPPYKEVEWSMRNNTNFMQTGVLSALELASGNAATILENFYRKSRNAVEAGKKEAPFGWTIPAKEKDQTRVSFLIDTLRTQGIEVSRLKDGAFLVRRDQPYGRLAKSLLEKQTFPDPSLRTYDDTGWTLGLMTGVEVKEIGDKEKALLDQPAEALDSYISKGSVAGDGKWLVVQHNGANRLITLLYHLKSEKFEALEKSSADIPAGSLVIANSARARAEVEKLGLVATAMNELPAGPKHAVDPPRLAMFSTWGRTQEVGWVRHAFDQFELPYELIYKERVKRGSLRKDFDVIVMPTQGFSAKGILQDVECKGQPLAYNKTGQYKNLGMYGESSDICGGMGLTGAAELERFVTEGGVLLTLGGSSTLPAETGIVRKVDTGRTSGAFYAPGPIVEAEILQSSHPIFYGYSGKTVPVRYANGPILQIAEQDKKQMVLMQFVGTEKSVLSGLMTRPAEIKEKPAIVTANVGQGKVVMFATNPCYRWQNHGEFNMLFNAVMHYNDWK